MLLRVSQIGWCLLRAKDAQLVPFSTEPTKAPAMLKARLSEEPGQGSDLPCRRHSWPSVSYCLPFVQIVPLNVIFKNHTWSFTFTTALTHYHVSSGLFSPDQVTLEVPPIGDDEKLCRPLGTTGVLHKDEPRHRIAEISREAGRLWQILKVSSPGRNDHGRTDLKERPRDLIGFISKKWRRLISVTILNSFHVSELSFSTLLWNYDLWINAGQLCTDILLSKQNWVCVQQNELWRDGD